MARQRKMDMNELLKATEELLLEKGYEGFHFKALSEKLDVARSTIYEYYSNKDELITDYMRLLMTEVMEKVKAIQTQPSSFQMLKELLTLFMEYSQVYDMIKMRPALNKSKSPTVIKDLNELDSHSQELFKILTIEIENAKKEGSIRQDLSSQLVASIFFNTVLIPNMERVPAKQWSEMIFSLIEHGIAVKK
ncbi:TetR/AcrR family transcriptional regulator [Jeotgalibacillus sp. S-D1]|uniref:TetR/AcrR family transcriptional regulator n=1 Tax=Jeotgalibacillus sp. S-D1 TaxID=2552189 RepID=UPI0010595283|nr:TetR/AcrR family transcriptional regulator [Jeotgalibacillus sp. S-D1]TDL35416.1 TetR/AcrR family transcriptional regulator [Jeotgalibacillus sp. S-D1]